jgi:hypothetical protein
MNAIPAADNVVTQTTRVIVDRSADGVVAVVAGLVVGPALAAMTAPVPGAGHGFAAAIDTLAGLFQEQATEQAFEDVVDQIPGRVAKLVVRGIGRSRRLLNKILGNRRHTMATQARQLAASGACDEGRPPALVAQLMGRLYNSTGVITQATTSLVGADWDRERREHRLVALQTTNQRWLYPVEFISRGLGPMRAVLIPSPLGPVPAAPVVGMVLLIWDVFISGDHLDARGPFPDFWKGVIHRADGG